MSLFKKTEAKTTKSPKGCMVVLNNPAGGDTLKVLEKLLLIAKKRSETCAVAELPCLGIPRIAYRFGIEPEAAQTVDQLIIDYDRGFVQDIHRYLYTHDGWDGLLIQPGSRPDMPTILKLQNEQTLMEIPGYLKSLLAGYNWIFVVTQGQMIHPMTFFSLREADHVVLVIDNPIDLIRTYATFKTLKQDYSINENRMTMFSFTKNSDFKEHKIVSRPEELFQTWRDQFDRHN